MASEGQRRTSFKAFMTFCESHKFLVIVVFSIIIAILTGVIGYIIGINSSSQTTSHFFVDVDGKFRPGSYIENGELKVFQYRAIDGIETFSNMTEACENLGAKLMPTPRSQSEWEAYEKIRKDENKTTIWMIGKSEESCPPGFYDCKTKEAESGNGLKIFGSNYSRLITANENKKCIFQGGSEKRLWKSEYCDWAKHSGICIKEMSTIRYQENRSTFK